MLELLEFDLVGQEGGRVRYIAVQVALDAGIPQKRVVVLGFSQGACLATEYVYRNSARYGGIAALSGGLIGPDEMARVRSTLDDLL